jgi:histidyl-tRNA synthetase
MKATKTVIYLMIAVVGVLMLSYFTGRTAEHADSQQLRDRKFYPVGVDTTQKATQTAVPYATQSISTSSTLKGKKELADENVEVSELARHSTVPPGSVVDTDLTPKLVSENKPATSDVRGNLGPASCITNETMVNWLTDRWQGTG